MQGQSRIERAIGNCFSFFERLMCTCVCVSKESPLIEDIVDRVKDKESEGAVWS